MNWRRQLVSVLAGELETFEFEYRCDAPDTPRWYTAHVRRVPQLGACISHRDITVERTAQLALDYARRHDPSTLLPNRRAMEVAISELVSVARAAGSAVSVAVIDLEGVDRVSDSLGRATGEDLLIDVAARLGECVKGTAILGRFAADTFIVVWEGVSGASEALDLAQSLLDGLREPFAVSDGYVDVSASIGVVFDRWPVDAAQELVVNAESATRRARTDGGSQVHLFTTDLRAGAAQRWRLEREIRTGIERGEFTLHYQPVVDLMCGDVIGVEALIRWQHPTGLRMPDSFIAVAESSGLIVPLGEWVLREACRQGAAWAERGLDLRVAVNFSAQQIGHAGVVRAIDDALLTTGMRGDRLLVEVTESTVLDHSERTLRVLDEIRARGIDVAIDDFGTGYSSLLYLKRYPIQAIKIDRQFVSGLGTTTEDEAIVAGVISFARAVGATCIAEGVESSAQYDLLQLLRCRFAQGYLFSPPVPPHEIPSAADACRLVLDRLSERLPSASDTPRSAVRS
jgi:diguanylate cyclase (GGDEF)-like protein